MKIKKLDATPYLMEGETLVYKCQSKQNSLSLLQSVLCYGLWLLTLAADAFLIGVSNTLRESLRNVSKVLMPIVIIALVIHLVPFAFWLFNVLKAKQINENKWYALTNKRILIITGTQPTTVTYINLTDVTSFLVDKNNINLAIGEERINLKGLQDPAPIEQALTAVFEGEKKEEKSVSEEE